MEIPGQKLEPIKFLSPSFNLRLIIVILLIHLYILTFKQISNFFGEGVPIFSLVPVVIAGWLLGMRIGTLVGVVMFSINASLHQGVFLNNPFEASFILGSVFIVLIGTLVGWLSDTLEKASTHYRQKLETEQTLLQAIEREQTLHEQIAKEKEGIERIVKQRTAELEQERSRLESSINSLNIGFIITDTKNNIVNMNSTAKRLLCLAEKGKKGKPGVLVDPLAINFECDINDVIEQLKDSFDFKKNLERCYKERQLIDVGEIEFREIFLHILMSPIVLFEKSELKVIGTVILIDDTTQKTMMERSKDEFFSIASHELRTPLTSIRGNTSLIKDYYSDVLKKDKNLSEMVNDIHESSVRLIEIVNDFLDTSRLEQGRMVYKKSEFSLKELSEEVVKELAGIVKEKKLYLKLKAEGDVPKVVADRDKVKQVLINLVGNSLKFTEKGGVNIEVSKKEPYGKVSVVDTGRGIDEPNQKLLFKKFQQANSSIITRDTTKGTGLGLYISKRMIEDMGGNIGLEKSEVGKGSTFGFTLPLVTAGEPIKVAAKA